MGKIEDTFIRDSSNLSSASASKMTKDVDDERTSSVSPTFSFASNPGSVYSNQLQAIYLQSPARNLDRDDETITGTPSSSFSHHSLASSTSVNTNGENIKRYEKVI